MFMAYLIVTILAAGANIYAATNALLRASVHRERSFRSIVNARFGPS